MTKAFETLAELDRIPFVGPVAFAKLLDRARDRGYVTGSGSSGSSGSPGAPTSWTPPDPWTVDMSCPEMTYEGLVAQFPGGAFEAYQPPPKIRTRTRAACNSVTGCSPWFDPGVVAFQQLLDREGHPGGSMYVVPSAMQGTTRLLVQLSMIDLDLGGSMDGDAEFLLQCRSERNGPIKECVVFVEFPRPQLGSVLEFEEAYPHSTDAFPWIKGRICADGRYHFVSRISSNYNSSGARDQIALWEVVMGGLGGPTPH